MALYGVEPRYELFLAPLENGSIVAWIGKPLGILSQAKVVLGATAAISGALIIQEGTQGFVEGLTGATIKDWAKIAGEQVSDFFPEASDNNPELLEQVKNSIISIECAARLMELNHSEFEEVISEKPEAADQILQGRRVFFETCRSDETISNVQFSMDNEARTIQRHEFSERTVRYLVAEFPEEQVPEGEWSSATLKISVTSPNWERLDQQRGWKGKISDEKYIFFHISDSRFWRMVGEERLTSTPPDVIEAQVFFQHVNGRYKSADVTKVLRFNEIPISDPLSSKEVSKKLIELNGAEAIQQGTLLGDP